MGLFGWHKCGEATCDAVLFVPLYDAPGRGNNSAEGGPSWAAYEKERARWHALGAGDASLTRCPAHAPRVETEAHDAPGDETMTTMTWDEFREQAVTRAGLHAIGGDPTVRLAYLALGLCGEAGEYGAARYARPYDRAVCLSELGDVAWYLAMIEHATGLRATWPTTDEWPGPLGMAERAGAVAECVKRPMQGRDLPAERFQLALDGVAAELAFEARAHDGMGAVYAANIAKTKARFGEGGFTVAQARALDAEAAR